MSKNIIGLKGIQKKLNRLQDPETYRQALGQSALIVESSAKQKAPVDKGLLRQSIHTEVDTSKLQATVGTPLSYAPYVEYGTGIHASKGDGRHTPWSYQRPDGQWVTTEGNRPQPFLGPALRENRRKVTDHFNHIVEKELKK